MRFTITALGSRGGRSVGQVVADIVRYLEPRQPEQPTPAVDGPSVPEGDGPSSYYADRGTEPGRWLGVGASEAALTGPVAPADFARVLAGRDPHTGRRLITASGSAGRRPTLGAGQATRVGPDGTALYDVDDIASALRVTKREANALLDAGHLTAATTWVRSLPSDLGVSIDARDEPDGAFLVPYVDAAGERFATGDEIDRCEHARTLGIDPRVIAANGDPTDQFTVADASRLAGVTSQYLRSLCRSWETDRNRIEADLEAGTPPARAYLVAYRGSRRRWVITRAELAAFLERRVAPAVRVGFDLTLTTEKSLGVLALLGDDTTRAVVLGAIQAGNDAGLAHLEYEASTARAKGKPVLARGMTIASFRHLTSRALDPFPHHHNVIANSVIDEHGTRRALDARGLYQHAQAAGEPHERGRG